MVTAGKDRLFKIIEMNTVEGNKLIAEFMGGQFNVDGKFVYFPLPKNKGYKSENLLYHTSWDWLMPVVIKIWDNNYEVRISSTECNIRDNHDEELIARFQIIPDDIMSAVWKAVVQFIQWYNKKNRLPNGKS